MPFNPRHHTQEALVLIRRDPETLEIRDAIVCPSRIHAMQTVSRHPEWEILLTHVVEHPLAYVKNRGTVDARSKLKRSPNWPGDQDQKPTLEHEVSGAAPSHEHESVRTRFFRLKDETDPHKILGIRPDADRDTIEAAYQQCLTLSRIHTHAETQSNPRWVIEAAKLIRDKYVSARQELLDHPTPGKGEP